MVQLIAHYSQCSRRAALAIHVTLGTCAVHACLIFPVCCSNVTGVHLYSCLHFTECSKGVIFLLEMTVFDWWKNRVTSIWRQYISNLFLLLSIGATISHLNNECAIRRVSLFYTIFLI